MVECTHLVGANVDRLPVVERLLSFPCSLFVVKLQMHSSKMLRFTDCPAMVFLLLWMNMLSDNTSLLLATCVKDVHPIGGFDLNYLKSPNSTYKRIAGRSENLNILLKSIKLVVNDTRLLLATCVKNIHPIGGFCLQPFLKDLTFTCSFCIPCWNLSRYHLWYSKKLKYLKEVNKSDGLWRFACGDVCI